jgi:hypothetical protein
MDLLSRIAGWLSDHQATISAVAATSLADATDGHPPVAQQRTSVAAAELQGASDQNFWLWGFRLTLGQAGHAPDARPEGFLGMLRHPTARRISLGGA